MRVHVRNYAGDIAGGVRRVVSDYKYCLASTFVCQAFHSCPFVVDGTDMKMASIKLSLQLPPAFDALQAPLLLLTNTLALTVGPQHRVLQLGLSIPVWIILVAQSLYRNYDGAWGIHYATNCAVANLLAIYVDTVLLASPDREGWTKLKSRVNTPASNEDSAGSMKDSKATDSSGFPENDGCVVKSIGISGSIAGKLAVKNTAPAGFRDRLWWAIRLACTTRYIGWSCEVKNVPVEVGESYPRW